MNKNRNPDIKYLFEPRSIAIIGASRNPDKIGYKVADNILSGGYTGRLYLVNPKGEEILGQQVYPSIEEIEDEVDVAYIVIPAKFVFDAVKSCVDKGVKFIPIITSGFSEIGNTEEEKKIVKYARENGARILGPNILGVFSGPTSLNATFGPKDVLAGNVAIISQSGALGIALMGKTVVENITLSAFLSIGNKADLDEADLLEYLMNHEETNVIMMYMEGVKDGERLLDTLKRVVKKKPVVVVKSGRSRRGAMAAASHTGSLAGSDDIFDAVMRQCDVLRAESIDEALNWCKFFASAPHRPAGENTVIITNGGGLGVLATDACEKYDVKMYDDYEDLESTFSEAMPHFGSAKNPVDITASVSHTYYENALKAALENDNIHAVAILYCQVAVCDIMELSKVIEEYFRKFKEKNKPLVFSPVGGKEVEDSIDFLRKHNVPVCIDPYDAISCLGAMYKHYHGLVDEPGDIMDSDIDVNSINQVVSNALGENRNFLLAHEAQKVMKAAGIQTPKSYVARHLEKVIKYSEEIGYPVVLKVVSKDIIHKSDAGGVALDLENQDEVIDAYQAIINSCRNYKSDAVIEGIEVSEMVKSGTEIIIGGRIDDSFGPIIMFGLGGVYVEVLKDISFRALPLARKEIINMMKETNSYSLLLGVRGEDQKDISCVVDTISKLGTIIQKSKNISDIEINPLVVYEQGKGVKALDARILLSKNSILDAKSESRPKQ